MARAEYCPGGTEQEMLAGIWRLCRHKPVTLQGLKGFAGFSSEEVPNGYLGAGAAAGRGGGFLFASLDPAAIQILSLSSTNLSHLPGGESLGSLVGGRAGKHQAWAESKL